MKTSVVGLADIYLRKSAPGVTVPSIYWVNRSGQIIKGRAGGDELSIDTQVTTSWQSLKAIVAAASEAIAPGTAALFWEDHIKANAVMALRSRGLISVANGALTSWLEVRYGEKVTGNVEQARLWHGDTLRFGSLDPSLETFRNVARYRLTSAASNNAAAIKASAGFVRRVRVENSAGYDVTLKLFDVSGAPDPATGTGIRKRVLCKAGTTVDVPFVDTIADPDGLGFPTAIGVAMTKGFGSTDNTATDADLIEADVWVA